MKKLIKYGKSGETLVEVMVCAVLFLMMAAVMQGAISFSTNAQHKSEQIRENNAKICRSLRTTETTGTGTKTKTYTFKATSMDGSVEGEEVFTIEVPLGKKEAAYQDGQGNNQTVDFYLYGPVTVTAGGGGTGGGGS